MLAWSVTLSPHIRLSCAGAIPKANGLDLQQPVLLPARSAVQPLLADDSLQLLRSHLCR